MAKIDRYSGDVKAFGSTATGTDRVVFGSPSGSPVQSDVLDDNVTTEFLEGWGVLAPGAKPPKQYFNGALYTVSQFISYLHQVGVPEWSGLQEYHINSIVNRNGVIYVCQTADHTSVTPPESDGVNWDNNPSSFAPQDTTYTKIESDAITDLLTTTTITQKLSKENASIPAFTKTGNFTVSTSQQLYVVAGDTALSIVSGTAVSMPTAVTGTDYAIWVNASGTVQATDNFVTPPATGSTKIGGFHYAPGGNATAQAGGDSVPQINEYSFWDLKYRPNRDDPRGFTCVAGSFWEAIYLLNNNPDLNGVSSYGKTIADGSSPPVIPSALGGNGSTTYGSLTWFEAASISVAMDARMITQPEFMAGAYGVTEATSRGTDPVTTGLDAPRTSKWGVMQATGNLYSWGQDRGGAFSTAGWNANTEGFGSEYNAPNASLLGANWNDGLIAGSRASFWLNSASYSNSNFSLRVACDHLQLD